ncbi:hypothetical protein V2A60_006021 [Cordyceps javanica]
MDAKADTRQSVDSNSPLLAKSQGSASSSADKNGNSAAAGGKEVEATARKNEARDKLNPEHPVSSIPFHMNQW